MSKTKTVVENEAVKGNLLEENSQVSRSGGEKLKILCLVSVQALFLMSMISSLAMLFPEEAVKKRVDQRLMYAIFSTTFFIIFLFSPILGRYFTAVGSKRLLLMGVFGRLLSLVIFSFLTYVDTAPVFIVLAFCLRAIEGIFGTAHLNAATTMLITVYPDRVSWVLGVLNAAEFSGVTSGPIVSGMLYDLGGYTLPFIVFGSLTSITVMVNFSQLPDVKNGLQQTDLSTTLHRLCNQKMFAFNLLTLVFVFGPFLFIESSLTNHLLEQLPHISHTYIGLLFASLPAFFAIGFFCWGVIQQVVFMPRPQIFLSALAAALGCLVLGPSRLFHPNTNTEPPGLTVPDVIIASLLIGFGVSGMHLACFNDNYVLGVSAGMEPGLNTYAQLTGLLMSSLWLGGALVPNIGGQLKQALDLPWTLTIISATFLFIGFIHLVIGATVYCCQIKGEKESETLNAR